MFQMENFESQRSKQFLTWETLWEEKTQYNTNESDPFPDISSAQRNNSMMGEKTVWWGIHRKLLEEHKLT